MPTIYHYSRCSKSRQTFALLEEHCSDFDVVEYNTNPPSKTELKSIVNKLGISPLELIRKGESVLDEENIDLKQLNDEQLIDLMLTHPILIQRPIVVTETAARIGRPPESVLDILK